MNFLFLSSDRLGSGDDALGRKLVEIFLDKLAQSNERVDVVGCVNSGVMLTTRDGPALDSLRRIAAKGAHIVSCGTCLAHHGLEDALAIGEVGSMAQTVEAMFHADRVIRP